MTIEQYGTGPFGVRIASDDCVGTYRFATPDEARAFRRANGGTLFRTRKPPVPLADLAALADTRAGRRMS